VGYFHNGDIIGAGKKDNEMSKDHNIWFQVTSTKLEVIKMKKDIFEGLWNS
jgi:hypothetical protein